MEARPASAAPLRFGPWKRELRSFFELFALSGIAVAQPALDLLSKNAGLFITLRTSKLQTVGVTLLLVVVPPVVLWAVEVLVGLIAPFLRRWAHAAIAAGIVAVIAVEVLKKQTDFAPRTLVAGAVVLGAAAGFVVFRFEIVRLWLRYLAIAPVIFAVAFLFFSPVTDVVFDSGPGAAADVRVGQPNRVVMVVLDELPVESLLDATGHIDPARYPNFAALAANATWYRNETTVAPYTEQAVPAILTGDYPTDPDALPVAQTYPHNLFTLLGGDYEMNVHENVTQLCPETLCGNRTKGADTGRHGFGALVDDTVDLWRTFASPTNKPAPLTLDASSVTGPSTQAGRSFIRSLAPTKRPRLDYLHILLPHQPWHLRGTLQDDEVRANRGLAFGAWRNDWTALSGRQRHLLQLQATDHLLGDMIRKLKRIDGYDDSLIVVTADHGVAFSAGSPARGVTVRNWPQIMWTPLLIKAPGQTTATIDDRPLRSIDVLPTMSEHLDVKLPWKVDGRSALGPPRPDGPRRLFEWADNLAKPPPGSKFLTFDGPRGFASVMGAPTIASGGDPALSLYRIGPFGDLVGRAVAPLIDASTPGPAGRISGQGRFRNVDPDAHLIPWAFVHGRLHFGEAGRPMAIAVNGVVAGVSATVGHGATGARTDFWSSLAPQLFAAGRNDVRAYLVTGTPQSPRLVAVTQS